MVKYTFLLIISFLSGLIFAQEVSQKKMAEIYEGVKTPYKYGLVVAPITNDYKIDCPTVFRKNGKWHMTYLVYNGQGGTDGRGYETWLAESDDLLHWGTKGRILSFRDGKWDANQRGGYPALPDMTWGGSYELQSYKNKYWLTYIGGANPGYEAGPLKIGLAYTPAKNITKAIEWKGFDEPILSPEDKDVQWFENITQYKSVVYYDKDESLGKPFVMFYNAGGINPENKIKAERIGIALSKDMKHWKRYPGNPVFTHEEGITGDAHIQKIGDVYVMFYFSAFRKDRNYKAFNTFACSYDLIHWTDWQGDDLIIPSKPYDDLFAHKSYVINHDGVVYHFYCAVNSANQRGIAVATSKPMGKSPVKFPEPPQKGRRTLISLNAGWKTWMDKDTLQVDIPHNWDDYYGYRNLLHGNLHGSATYTKTFTIPSLPKEKQAFIRFEGVGTYADITLNGKHLGRYPGGRTTFTLHITEELLQDQENMLTVITEHPEMITDMPWVCGGCSSEWGFSEGSQPLGIFRPVTLEITDEVRIEPFGVHVWHNDRMDTVFIETEVKNYGKTTIEAELVNKLNNEDGIGVFRLPQKIILQPGETKTFRQSSPISNPQLWSIERPYLYNLASMIKREGKTTEEISTPFGIRTISWPVKRDDGDGRFFLNGKAVFLNGIGEYEHQFGQSHAFSPEQIASRVKQIRNAGFNAFRDAHQPHNLEYQRLLDKSGMLCWTQMSAHIWYDTPAFRENFKTLLRQWVKERRNSPSVVIWGLQNESVLPEDFARECSNIIREMDPTARNMRIITTCNGGKGTDWNVVQNWSGTYSGDPDLYASELKRPDQLLNGEYGAWRSIDLHTEPGKFEPKGAWSEDRMCRLMEMKIKQAEQVRDSVSGQFLWIFSSHDNPGRIQPDEGYRMIDKVGPFNYKGLTTPWEEPLDVYYMYHSNYVSAAKDPMVYIVSHTWPDRFKTGRRADIDVYSNCDSVKLYNDATDNQYLGKKKNNGKGTHMTWENRDIRYNVLRAVGYYGGKAVAEDIIVLDNLEKAPDFDKLYEGSTDMLRGETGYNYIYRINCGGDDYTDEFNQHWIKDDTTFSTSWASAFKGLNPYMASQRVTHDPIRGVKDWSLLGHFRFGRHRLQYHFPVPDGKYRIELYFIEPWHGTGGGAGTDCEGMRLFDVAVNDSVVIDDLDIWAEKGHDGAFKKVIYANIQNGILNISFPEVKAGQAIISAIAIASENTNLQAPEMAQSDWSWKKASKDVSIKMPEELMPKNDNIRKSTEYPAIKAVVQGNQAQKTHKDKAGVFFLKGQHASIQWNISTGLAQAYALRFNYMNNTGKARIVNLKLMNAGGDILKNDSITLPDTPGKWKLVNTTTGNYINAGDYKVVISAPDMEGLAFESLEVQ